MRARLFEPLGLKHTFVEVFEPVPVKIVRGYVFEGADVREIGDKYQGGGLPDGGIVTTPEDMVKFMRALFVDWKLLDTATMTLMLTPVADAGDGSQVGYQIFITKTRNSTRYEHDGSIDGYNAIEMHYPESNITIAMWTNGDGGEQDTIFANFQDAVDKLVFPSNP
jgi:D-alanyl-D-alanine carboxypeptidase